MPVNLVPLPPLDPLALSLYRLCTTAFLVSPGSSNDPIYHALAVLLLHLALLVGREEADADAAAADNAARAAGDDAGRCRAAHPRALRLCGLGDVALPAGAVVTSSTPARAHDAHGYGGPVHTLWRERWLPWACQAIMGVVWNAFPMNVGRLVLPALAARTILIHDTKHEGQ